MLPTLAGASGLRAQAPDSRGVYSGRRASYRGARWGQRSFRCSWTNCTAIDPSPTADATRLTDPDRTSPAANTPGRLVSRKNGGRFAVQCGDDTRPGPVLTNCFSSPSIWRGSPSVRGTPPMQLNPAGDVSP